MIPIDNTAEMIKEGRPGRFRSMLPVEERWEQWKARYATLRETIYRMVVLELGRSVA